MKINVRLVIFICVLFMSSAYAQAEYFSPYTPKVLHASPDAASLGKYGEYPVDYYTGIPQINLPLYELNAGQLSLPISLSYHASGIKVDDIASSVGLGWSLNAGGCIAVQCVGEPDFRLDENEQLIRNTMPALTFEQFSIHNIVWTNLESLDPYNTQIDPKDAEHDIYTYNVNGRVGQFVLQNDSVFFLNNCDGIEILFNFATNSFTMVDNDGIRYVFDCRELTESEIGTIDMNYLHGTTYPVFRDPTPSSRINKNYTAWYLHYMISADALDTLTFSYLSTNEVYSTRPLGYIKTYTESCTDANSGAYGDYGIRSFNTRFNNQSWDNFYCNKQTFSNQQIQHNALLISAIVHNRTQNRIIFSYSDRQDLEGGKQLDEIAVYAYGTTRVKKLSLQHGYFTTDWHDRTDTTLHKRLKLASVQEIASNGQRMPLYSFSYYSENNHKLPYRNCPNGFDHWGYFNEEITNAENAYSALRSFPKMNEVVEYTNHQILFFDQYLSTSYSSLGITIPNDMQSLNNFIAKCGNRQLNGSCLQALSLKSITYPTGGMTEFQYEPHSCAMAGGVGSQTLFVSGLRIHKIVSKTSNDSVVKAYHYTQGNSLYFARPNYFYHIRDPYVVSTATSSVYGCMNFSNFPDFSNISYGELVTYGTIEEITSATNNTSKVEYNYSISNYLSDQTSVEGVGVVRNNVFACSALLLNRTNYGCTIQPFNEKILGRFYQNASLQSTKYFNNDTLIKQISYDYTLHDSRKIFSNIVRQYELAQYQCFSYTSEPSYYFVDIYYLQTGKKFLKHKQEITFNHDGLHPVEQNTYYTYNYDTELLKSLSDSINATKIICTNYKYSTDYIPPSDTHPIAGMQNKHIVHPIMYDKSDHGNIIESQVLTYDYYNGAIRPSAQYQLTLTEPLSSPGNMVTLNNNSYTLDSLMRNNCVYQYHEDGNLFEVFDKTSGQRTCYLWSYKHQYPTMQIDGIYAEQLLNAIGSNVIMSLAINEMPTLNDLLSLKNQISNKLPYAHISVYTYKPLMGISTMTTDAGLTTYYEYDDFGRLKLIYQIKNKQREVIKAFDYNFKL